jgi:hypothetical protein
MKSLRIIASLVTAVALVGLAPSVGAQTVLTMSS